MMGTTLICAPKAYLNKEKCRVLTQKERRKLLDMYINDKYSVSHISIYMNTKKAIVEDHLFGNGKSKSFVEPKITSSIGFAPRTYYWRDEDQIMESLDPKYDENELINWEKEALNNTIKSEYKIQVM